jgi:hypothetical protein
VELLIDKTLRNIKNGLFNEDSYITILKTIGTRKFKKDSPFEKTSDLKDFQSFMESREKPFH